MSKYPYIVRNSKRCMWGYEVDKDDPDLWKPIEPMLDKLHEGFELIKKGVSFQDVSNWLYASTGVPLAQSKVWKKYHQWVKKQKEEKKLDRKRRAEARAEKKDTAQGLDQTLSSNEEATA